MTVNKGQMMRELTDLLGFASIIVHLFLDLVKKAGMLGPHDLGRTISVARRLAFAGTEWTFLVTGDD